MLVSSISGVEPTTILRSAKAQRALFGKQDRRTLGARLHRVRLVDEQHARRVPSEVPWSLAGDDLQRAASEQAMQDRRAILAVINLARERTAQGRARLKRRLKVRNHVVAAVGLGRQQAQDRRRLIGDEVPEGAGQQRVKPTRAALHQRHPLDGRGPRCCRRSPADTATAASDPEPPSSPCGRRTLASIQADSGSRSGGIRLASARRRTSDSAVMAQLSQHGPELQVERRPILEAQFRQPRRHRQNPAPNQSQDSAPLALNGLCFRPGSPVDARS